jgi:small conductance mechanosensitive channel
VKIINIEGIILTVLTFITTQGLTLLGAVLLVFIGFKVVQWVVGIIEKGFNKSKMDISLAKFLLSAINIALKVAIVIMAITMVFESATATIITVLGTVGIGVGLALQGSLANLAGGILILVLRPFNVGDYIAESAYGNEGMVQDIHVFYTTLVTNDKKTIIIPNGNLSNGSITNFTREKLRRVDLKFGVDYNSDINKVKAAIRAVIEANDLIVNKDQSVIKLSEHGDSAINFLTLVWCAPANYLTVKFDMIENVKLKFDEENISIPYPHMDVKILNQ